MVMLTPSDLGIVHPGVFCVAVLLLNLTPGPDTAFIVGQSVAHGRRVGLMSVLGISSGFIVHTSALALGLSAILAASASAFTVIKVVGAIYLVFLGGRMIVASVGRPSAAEPVADGVPARRGTASPRRAFVQGFLTNVLNPKVVLFFLSFLPQFVAATSPSKALAFVVLGVVLAAISTVYNGVVAIIAGGLTRRMRTVPRVKRWLDRSIGAAFIALGARIAFAEP
jgi:threonine/homoserine/homoserine lactone efflux protein